MFFVSGFFPEFDNDYSDLKTWLKEPFLQRPAPEGAHFYYQAEFFICWRQVGSGADGGGGDDEDDEEEAGKDFYYAGNLPVRSLLGLQGATRSLKSFYGLFTPSTLSTSSLSPRSSPEAGLVSVVIGFSRPVLGGFATWPGRRFLFCSSFVHVFVHLRG